MSDRKATLTIDGIDEVIRTIRQAPDVPTASARLRERFELSEIQADHILRMQLRTLTALYPLRIPGGGQAGPVRRGSVICRKGCSPPAEGHP